MQGARGAAESTTTYPAGLPSAPVKVRPGDVLSYWFDGPSLRSAIWSDVDPRTRDEVRERFGAVVERALRGRLRAWRWSLGGRVALVLLLDVFPRHLWVGPSGAVSWGPSGRRPPPSPPSPPAASAGCRPSSAPSCTCP